jgi:hypothetical protein
MSKIKQQCEQYLGNRGIYQPVKRCAQYENLWFILFEDDDNEVEVSFAGWCYECYDLIRTNKMKWNKAFYAEVKKDLERQQKEWDNRSK